MHPDLAAAAARQSGVFTTAQALDAGYSHNEIRTLTRSGSWRRLRRSAYVDSKTWGKADANQRHLLTIAALQAATTHPIAASHYSAAWLHGLPLIRPEPVLPHVTADRNAVRTLTDARLFNGALKNHTLTVDGLLTTNVARTISDIARTRALDDALVMLEHGLRNGMVTTDSYQEVVQDCPTWRGISTSKRILRLAQPLNESPGESLSYLRMRQHGIELPLCQAEVRVGPRRYRLDFLWPWAATAGEFDGRMKYAAKEDLYAEKRREDDLRSVGLSIARWGWKDVMPDGIAMAAAINRAFSLASARMHEPGADEWRRYLHEPTGVMPSVGLSPSQRHDSPTEGMTPRGRSA